MFELKKYGGVMFHENKEWYKIWRKTDFWFGNRYEEFRKFSPQQIWLYQNEDFDGIFLFKVENVWA